MLDELAVLFVFFLDAKVTKVCVVKVEPLEVYVSDEMLTSVLEADAVDAANVSLVTLGVHQISWVVTSPLLKVSVVVYNGSSQFVVVLPVVVSEEPVEEASEDDPVEVAEEVVEASHQTYEVTVTPSALVVTAVDNGASANSAVVTETVLDSLEVPVAEDSAEDLAEDLAEVEACDSVADVVEASHQT